MRKYLISILFIALMAVSFGLLAAPADIASIREENRELKTMPEITFSSEWRILKEFRGVC